jgi:hypothetical protein
MRLVPITVAAALSAASLCAQGTPLDFLNGNRPVADAHNCYIEKGQWANRIGRALATGFPIGIEQDLAWYEDPSGKGRAVVSHSDKPNGSEPTLRAHFFERVRPIVEKALAENRRAEWPAIVLHFDFKTQNPKLLHAVWDLLGEYQAWITTAPKGTDPYRLEPFDAKPLLVLTEHPDEQEAVFFNQVPAGGRLRLFGSAHTNPVTGTREERRHLEATLPPEKLLSSRPTNYRRWWNTGWSIVEEGGQRAAGPWTADDDRRLRALVDHAHRLGYWIRFYTLDGFTPAESQGWGESYNFGSREAVEARWKAVLAAGVNLIAADQYEGLTAFMQQTGYRAGAKSH